MKNYSMSFAEWLHQPSPNWKINIERCHPSVFKELKMSKEDVEKILEKLEEYHVFDTPQD
ncbi:hypothetical protein [Paenisporosarcina sp. NPDC076898]|uniref:hypothetical protein n=1 Tax=unclassified Paenisporosarcina TaxID=2642018 RepID=UPI003D024426